VESGVHGGFIYTTTLAARLISLPSGGYSPRHPLQNRVGLFQRRSECSDDDSFVQYYCSPLSTGVLYGRLQRVTIPDAVIIQIVLLKKSIVLLETC